MEIVAVYGEIEVTSPAPTIPQAEIEAAARAIYEKYFTLRPKTEWKQQFEKWPDNEWQDYAVAALTAASQARSPAAGVGELARIIDPTAFSCPPSMYNLKTEAELEAKTLVGGARNVARDKALAILVLIATKSPPAQSPVATGKK